MTTRELLYIKTIADERNMTRAAQKLFVTQPSLSHCVTNIEDQLGVRLFTRTSGGLILTYAGEKYYRMACEVLRVYASFESEIVEERTLSHGRVTDSALCERAVLSRLRVMTEEDWRGYDPGGEGLYHRLYQAARSACTVDGLLSAAKTKRYPLARLRRMALAAYLQLPPAPAQVPYIRVLAATAVGRAHLRRLRDAGAPVLTKPADVSSLGADAAALFALEGRCTDLYVLARPDLTQSAPGQDYRTTPVMV